MSDTDQFAIQLRRVGLGPWQWSIIDREGRVVSHGEGRRQDEARRSALVRARSLSGQMPVMEPA